MARAKTPATRADVANDVVGSSPPERAVDAPHVRSARTPCRPTMASHASAGGTTNHAASPSPEFVADPRKAASSGTPAAPGLRHVTASASTARAVRPTSRLMPRTTPRFAGAGTVYVVIVVYASPSRKPSALPVSGTGSRSRHRWPWPWISAVPCSSTSTWAATTRGRTVVSARIPIPVRTTSATRRALGRNQAAVGSNRLVSGSVVARVATPARTPSSTRARPFTVPPPPGRRPARTTRPPGSSRGRRRR